MVKRVIGLVTIAILCGGCATVSMKPANLTASFAKPKSELNKSAKAYCELAEEQGWVEASSPMMFLQRSLFPDAESEAAEKDAYYKTIGVESEGLEVVEARLTTDIQSAHVSLNNLNSLAGGFVTENEPVERADVASFEEALVTARKSRRSFAEAKDMLKQERNLASDQIETELGLLDAEIERSKELADTLAAVWQGKAQSTS